MILLTVQPKMARQTASRRLQPWRTIWSQLCRQENCLMLTFILILEPERANAFLSTWSKTFLHTREKEVFFLNTLKIFLAQTLQEGPFQVMLFVVTQQQKEQKKPNTRMREGQDTAKITSAPAESCSDADLDDNTDVRNIRNRTQSSSSQKRSMKQDLSGSTTSFPYWWECCVCVWLLWTFCIVLRPLLPAWSPWRY